MTRPESLDIDDSRSNAQETLNPRAQKGRVADNRLRVVSEILPLFLVALVYALGQIRFLRVPDVGDQADYFNAAFDFPAISLSHRHSRSGLLFPVRALQETFGFSEIAYYTVPIASGIMLSVATYLLGRLLFNRAVGLGAGVLVLLNPYMMRDSSHLLPDIPAAAMFTWAIVLVIFAGRRLGQNRHPDWPARLLLAGAGVFLGWSYLTREFTVLFFPLVLASFWAFRIRWRYLTYVAGAALAALAFELVVSDIAWDRPFARFEHVLGRRGSAATSPRWGPIESLVLLPRLLLAESVGPFFIALLALVAIGAAVKRDRGAVLLVTWTFGVWAFFLLISHQSAFDAVHFLSGGDIAFVSLRFEKLRYWSPIWPAIAVGGLGGMLSIYRWAVRAGPSKGPGSKPETKRSAFAVGSGVAILLTATIAVGVGLDQVQGWTSLWIADESTHYAEFREWLEKNGVSHDLIWTDRLTARVLPIYTAGPFGTPIWRGDIRSYNGPQDWLPEEDLEPGLVVVHSESVRRTHGPAIPPYTLDPPDAWERVAELGILTIYQITPP